MRFFICVSVRPGLMDSEEWGNFLIWFKLMPVSRCGGLSLPAGVRNSDRLKKK